MLITDYRSDVYIFMDEREQIFSAVAQQVVLSLTSVWVMQIDGMLFYLPVLDHNQRISQNVQGKMSHYKKKATYDFSR